MDYSGSPIEGGAGYEIGNPQRFGQDFIDRVANTRDIVQFHRRAQGTSKSSFISSSFPFLSYFLPTSFLLKTNHYKKKTEQVELKLRLIIQMD